ncbi:MAG: adenosine deaminase [Deltaproteobacteria bacterium]|nr:adenosine deaminase [Deltaproteobacteria bacterium]
MKRDERQAILKGLPKIELHRHLEGSLRLSTMLELGRKYDLDLPLDSPAALAKVVTFSKSEPRTLANFLTKFYSGWYRSYADIERVTREAVNDAADEGIVHLELRFSPEHLTRSNKLQPRGVMQAVCESGQATAAERSISIKFLITFARERYEYSFWKELIDVGVELEELGIAGVDLAGDEFNFPNRDYQKIFLRARDTGVLGISIHSGEGTSAEQVATAVDLLGADRIGHGLKAVDDPEVIGRLVESGVALEMCPISNFQTGCIDKLPEHPLPQLDLAGIAVTLNADDPAIHRTTINDDYDVAVTRWGYNLEDLLRLERNSISAAFISDEQRATLSERVNQGYAISQGQGL